eukprot:4868985-Pyramimonas_sp.AAC.1
MERTGGRGGRIDQMRGRRCKFSASYRLCNVYIYKMVDRNIPVVFAHDGQGPQPCLLYTSDAADDTPCVDLSGR